MNKKPYNYTPTQFDEMKQFIKENFGVQYDFVAHELESDYVHTDTFVGKAVDGDSIFVTCGMGARKMQSPFGEERCELVASAAEPYTCTSEKAMVIAGAMQSISKFPFREQTWLGPGHTIDVSKHFTETFGYDYFGFWDMDLSATLTGLDGEVRFFLTYRTK